jgi:hypothetical protein
MLVLSCKVNGINRAWQRITVNLCVNSAGIHRANGQESVPAVIPGTVWWRQPLRKNQ